MLIIKQTHDSKNKTTHVGFDGFMFYKHRYINCLYTDTGTSLVGNTVNFSTINYRLTV